LCKALESLSQRMLALTLRALEARHRSVKKS